MKQYVIAQHPIKMSLEFDNEWMNALGIADSNIDEMVEEWEGVIKRVSMYMYNEKARKDASEAMKGGDE